MKEQFFDIIKNHYADFDGRARRKEYWMFVLWFFVIYLAFVVFNTILISIGSDVTNTLSMVVSVIFSLGCLAITIPNLALAVRRLHDTGKSGWFLLIGLIPFVGGIILLVFYCMDSQPGDNEYGPNPKGIGNTGFYPNN